MTDNIELSLCVIRWNDEDRLADFLEQIAGLADEIIIMNLASKDQVIEDAKRADARILRTEWSGSRSRIKNECLDQARGRWALFLEPDEHLPKEQWSHLRMLLQNPTAEEYYIYVDQGQGNNMINTPAESLRLIRNRAAYRYQYRSFEYISDDLISNIRESNLRIQKQKNPASLRQEEERLMLLKADQTEHPEDCFINYISGIALLNQRRYEAARDSFLSAGKKINPDYFYAPHLFKCLVWADLSLEDYENALSAAEEGIGLFPEYADLFALRGELYKRMKKYKEAILDYENGLKILQNPGAKAYGSEISAAVVFENLGQLYEKELAYKKAASYYQQVLRCGIVTSELIYKAAEMILKSGGTEVLKLQMQEAAEKENLEMMMIFIDLFYRNLEYQEVLSYLANLEPFIEKEEADFIRYSCCKMLGRKEEADLHLLQIKENPGFLEQIRLQEIEQKWNENLLEEASELIQDMKENERIESSALKAYSMIQQALAGSDCFACVPDFQEQELIRGIMIRFLWRRQTAKAQRIMPLLIKGKSAEEQAEIYKGIAGCLLRFEGDVGIQEMGLSDNPLVTEEIQLALWARESMERLHRWITRVPIVDSRKRDAAIEHFVMGTRFEESGKTKEALFAFLRALQLDPFEESVREKLRILYFSEPEKHFTLLQSIYWVTEGDAFGSKEEFLSYAKGLFAFFAGNLSEAVKFFSESENTGAVCAPGLAQLIACLWLNGDVEKAEVMKNGNNSCVLNEKIYTICKSYVLQKLMEYNDQNCDSEQIRREMQKIN